jgi:predicted HTH domain antitoxin
MNDTITFELPRSVLDSARLSVPELKVELAMLLYQQKRLSIGKARELAGMTLWQFRQVLGSHQISPHYGIEEYREDVETLRQMGQL